MKTMKIVSKDTKLTPRSTWRNYGETQTGTNPVWDSLPKDRRLDGASLKPLLLKNRSLGRRRLFWEYNQAVSMRDGDWKLVRKGKDAWELHNMAEGRTETRNLAEKYPEKVAAMEKLWLDWYEECTGKEWSEAGGKKREKK